MYTLYVFRYLGVYVCMYVCMYQEHLKKKKKQHTQQIHRVFAHTWRINRILILILMIDKSMSSSEYVLKATLIFSTWESAGAFKAHLSVLG